MYHRLVSIGLFSCITFSAQAYDFSTTVGVESRYFPSKGLYPEQENSDISLTVKPLFQHSWDNDRKKIVFSPYYRFDNTDDKRFHTDIRQFDVTIAKGNWEIQGGVGKIFWGVSESQHLVDVINQTDNVDDIGGNEKLGQPLFRVSRLFDEGALDLIVLPYFRERTFPGSKGRFRYGLVVDTDQVTYESNKKENNIDYALRWTRTVGNFDIGLSWFDGTNRRPDLRIGSKEGEAVLIPHYGQLKQAGIDVQYTSDGLLLKLEAVNRQTTKQDYQAATGGFEYTFSDINKKGLDLGLLAEYHYDSRGSDATSPLQKDIFIGTRLAFNDTSGTQLLAGTMLDLDYKTRTFRAEGSRRWGDKTKLTLEMQYVTNTNTKDPMHSFRQDDYFKLGVERFF